MSQPVEVCVERIPGPGRPRFVVIDIETTGATPGRRTWVSPAMTELEVRGALRKRGLADHQADRLLNEAVLHAVGEPPCETMAS